MDRLIREGNPPSSQLASPVPQAWDPNLGDFREITGQNLGGGRFGTDGIQWGKTASGLFVPVKVTNEGVQEVQVSGNFVTLYGERTPTIEPGQQLEATRLKIPNNVSRLKLAIGGSTVDVQAMEVTIRTALEDANLDFPSACFWQTVEKPYDSESWKNLGGNARSKLIDTFGDWVKISIKNTSTTTPYYVRFYVGGAQ